jgi:hypothetical protein
MYKEIYVREFAPAISDYVLNAANGARTGMACVISNAAAKEVGLATGDANLYVMDKERIATGINATYQNLPDSFEEFNVFANGDRPIMRKLIPGEVFAVDEKAIANVSNFVNAAYLTANAGMWEPTANAGVDTSKYVQTGRTTMVGPTKLYQIAVNE